MRLKYFLPILVVILALVGCQKVQKPELRGEGPLAVTVARGTAVPEYHAPADRWRTYHGEAVTSGDFSRRECILCHDPQTGCNQCHKYIGAAEISVPEASLYWSNKNGRE